MMDFRTNPEGSKWAWARTGALVLFVVAGLLLIASLNTARSQLDDGLPKAPISVAD
jgi:hypothetical protein